MWICSTIRSNAQSSCCFFFHSFVHLLTLNSSQHSPFLPLLVFTCIFCISCCCCGCCRRSFITATRERESSALWLLSVSTCSCMNLPFSKINTVHRHTDTHALPYLKAKHSAVCLLCFYLSLSRSLSRSYFVVSLCLPFSCRLFHPNSSLFRVCLHLSPLKYRHLSTLLFDLISFEHVYVCVCV